VRDFKAFPVTPISSKSDDYERQFRKNSVEVGGVGVVSSYNILYCNLLSGCQ